ncbi:Potassium voltage-gated channel subfamily V member [Saliniradius amylolyticus]|uniref:Potassium voltage-gated channel subfamily V member n=1 Tax=Saliniradius amylolyticus TaxID=2183582 RepID=A0A2S2E5H3_9ALTE|nr:potassium channel family protein [Saliniradius amylolyticus]AWL12849.1 Potassium voltage-gated channel subfamily V member [Saliniradius amylolyticus]
MSHQLRPHLNPFDVGMMILSVVAVAVVVVYLLLPLSAEVKRYLLFIDTLICLLFLSHFFYHLLSSQDKKAYFKHHWIDFVASIPLIEPLRIARFLQVLRVIRLLKMTKQVVLPSLRNRIQTTLATMMVVLVLLIGAAGLAIYLLEYDIPASNIKTPEDAIWWSLVTISTVGYGDYYPVTTAGRVVSMLLILSGVSLFGVISGYIASYFITPEEKDQLAVQNQRINELQQDLKHMQQSLEQLHQKMDNLGRGRQDDS